MNDALVYKINISIDILFDKINIEFIFNRKSTTTYSLINSSSIVVKYVVSIEQILNSDKFLFHCQFTRPGKVSVIQHRLRKFFKPNCDYSDFILQIALLAKTFLITIC